MTDRKSARKSISPFRLHTKKFEKSKLKESTLDDGSIMFEIEWYASTKDKDFDWDIIKPEAIKIDRYMVNPIMKKQHMRWTEHNIWLCKDIVFDDQWMYIYAELILHPDIPEHKTLIHGLRHGLVNWFSIGFAEVEIWYDEELKAKAIQSLSIHEISLVDIPNNPMTVRKMMGIVEQRAKETGSDTVVFDTEDEEDNNLSDTTPNSNDSNDKTTADDDQTDPSSTDADIPSDLPAGKSTGELKAKTIEQYIKQLSAWELSVWQMIRFVKVTERMDRDGDVYSREYCNNAEIVKIEQDADDTENPTLYLLNYKLNLDGREATTYLDKYKFNEITMINLTEEQLKWLKWEVVTKSIEEVAEKIGDIVEDTIQDVWEKLWEAVWEVVEWAEEIAEVIVDELSGDPKEQSDITDNTESTEGEVIWNDNNDGGEVAAEKSFWNEDSVTKELEEKSLLIKDLQDQLVSKDALIAEKDGIISQKDADIAEANTLMDQAAAKLKEFSDTITTLTTTLEKVESNYKKLWKLYTNSEIHDEETKDVSWDVKAGNILKAKLAWQI